MYKSLDKYDLIDNLTDQLLIFAYGVIFWTTLNWIVVNNFSFKQLSNKDSNDTKNRIVSIVHGFLTFFITLYHLKMHNPQFGAPNTNIQHFILIFSQAYFFYDSIACYYYKITSPGFMIHHAMVILGYGTAIMADYGATEALTGLFFAEVSNFPMHTRAILRSFNLHYTKIYELIDFMFMVSYIISRAIFVPISLVYPCLLAELTPLGVKFICVGIAGQSFLYVYKMGRISKKKLSNLKERNSKNVSYFWFSTNPKVKDLDYVKNSKDEGIL